VADTCKKSLLIDLETLRYLSKYHFRERRQWYYREIYCKNNYAIENEDCEHGVWKIHDVFIAHDVGFLNVIHAAKTIKQNYSRVSRILLDRSKVIYGFITWRSDLLWLWINL
jgi:hypothetical protein